MSTGTMSRRRAANASAARSAGAQATRPRRQRPTARTNTGTLRGLPRKSPGAGGGTLRKGQARPAAEARTGVRTGATAGGPVMTATGRSGRPRPTLARPHWLLAPWRLSSKRGARSGRLTLGRGLPLPPWELLLLTPLQARPGVRTLGTEARDL